MGKFKKSAFVEQYKAIERENAKQEELRKKYNIDSNVKVVEKSNMAKFTISTIKNIIKSCAGIIIIILAIIGIYSLVVADIRTPLINNLKDVWQYITNTLNL